MQICMKKWHPWSHGIALMCKPRFCCSLRSLGVTCYRLNTLSESYFLLVILNYLCLYLCLLYLSFWVSPQFKFNDIFFGLFSKSWQFNTHNIYSLVTDMSDIFGKMSANTPPWKYIRIKLCWSVGEANSSNYIGAKPSIIELNYVKIQ